jgi:hypothetical protein
MPAATADASRARHHLIGSVARAWPSLVAGAVVLGALVWLAWQAGGYFPPDYLAVGAVVFLAGGAVLLVHVPRYALSTEALVGFGALAAYAGWAGLSSTWSPFPDGALDAMQRNLVHAGVFGLALIAAGSGRYARHLVWAVLLAICIIAGAGLISRLYPDVIRENVVLATGSTYRLSYPWTYWNAAGALAAMGCVLATGLAADPRSRAALRAVSAGAAVLLFVTMYLSFSRGAWLALIAGVVVLIAVGAHRGSLLLTIAVVGGAVTLALLRLRGYPELTIDPAIGSGQERAGRAYGLQLFLLSAAAASLQAVIAAGRASRPVMRELRRVARPAAAVAGTAAIVLAVAVYGVRGASLEGHVTTAANSTADWVSAQWGDFLRPSVPVTTEGGAARLLTVSGTRSDLYRVALESFADHPLRGEGAGSYEARYIRDRDVGDSVRNAHSLGLETLGELGVVGALLLVAFIGSLAAAVVRGRRRPGALGRSQVAAVGASCTVWLVHSNLDWDWQVSALTGTFLVLAATLYPVGRGRVRRRRLVPG